jgi:hypothetical protein
MLIARLGRLLSITVPLVLSLSPPATANPGTWGAGNFPYSNGVVCNSDDGSVPLVAWNIAGNPGPAFTLGGLASRSGLDDGIPPQHPASYPVYIGSVGFSSEQQITATAWLLWRWGGSADASRVAEVAELIAEHAGAATGASCVDRGIGGVSRAQADEMWQEAVRSAGPYQLDVQPQSPQIAGRPISIRAHVGSALGFPVPGLAVKFTGGEPRTATTDFSGNAFATVTLAAGSAPLRLQATATAPMDLVRLSSPGAVDAVTLPTLTPVTASTSLLPDPHSDPVITTGLGTHLARPGASIPVSASVTGMNGHQAKVILTVAGPLPVDQHGTCETASPREWSDAIRTHPSLVMVVSDATITDDSVISAPSFAPKNIGCYSTAAQLMTVDATPNVTRTAAFATLAGTVTITSATAAIDPTARKIIGSGPVDVPIVVQHSADSAIAVTGLVRGPWPPIRGSCAGAPRGQPVVSTISGYGAGDQTMNVRSSPVTAAGCYDITMDVANQFGAAGAIHTTLHTVVLLLYPAVAVYESATSAAAGQPLTATAIVTGTYRQSGMLRTALMRGPAADPGCGAVNWSAARPIAATVDAISRGDDTYSLTLPRFDGQGCYAIAVELSLDANRSVSGTNPIGRPESVFLGTSVPTLVRPDLSPASHSSLALWLTTAAVAATLSATCASVGMLAYRGRNDTQPDAGLDGIPPASD